MQTFSSTPSQTAASRALLDTPHAASRTEQRRNRRVLNAAAALALVLMVAPQLAYAQGGQGGQAGGSSTPPAASSGLKRTMDRNDPLAFLLDRKKMLHIDKTLEDSLKYFRKDMQRRQEVVYKDLDKAATTKEQGQLPSTTLILSLTKESEERVKDIQSAYKDRARALLSETQKSQLDSLENIWKRDVPKAEVPTRRPPPAVR